MTDEAPIGSSAASLPLFPGGTGSTPRWAKVVDQTRCIGCHACTTACKSENQVPVGVNRTYVKSVEVGTFPATGRAFQVTRCNQCEDAPCVTACPTASMFQRDDGIVDFDKDACIGCKACIAACPYDAIFINPEDHAAEKCNFCTHRIEVGLEPACAVVCPVDAIIVGDLDDPTSRVARTVDSEPVAVRRPEKATRPKLFYRGADQATLDPLAARRPDGDTYAWAQQPPTNRHQMSAGVPGGAVTSSAAALLTYDVPHTVPWDWRVSLYTWTKGVAAGVYVLAALLVGLGTLSSATTLWRWATPVVASAFLALTVGLLVADLEQPRRFYYVLTRPQWRSWLVRGGVILSAFAAVLGAHLVVVLVGLPSWAAPMATVGVPLGVATAGYTAFLFAQAKARDLWQSPLLAPHLLVQGALAGSATLLILAAWLEPGLTDPLATTLQVSVAAHLVLVLAEVALPHPTAAAAQASREMTTGRFRHWWASGLALAALGLLAPWAWPVAAPAALLGLLAHEHAYVQAGQSVPLA